MRTIDNINDLNKSDFLSIFGNVFEKTESVALEAFESKPFKNFEDIVLKMLNIYENYEKNKILEILNAHPELAVAKKMTSESISEQASAKLNQCSNDEYEEFERLNKDYKKKFGFPFIIAVKEKNKDEILKYFKQRIKNNPEVEFIEAKLQVKKIASLRLNEILI